MTQHLFDELKREALIKKIDELGGVDHNTVFVSVDDFFGGNYDDSSIGCDLLDHPGIDFFYETLSKLEQNDAVSRVQVEVYDVDEDTWPYSERIWITTSLSEQEIVDLCLDLQFDEIWEETVDDSDEDGEQTVFILWWD